MNANKVQSKRSVGNHRDVGAVVFSPSGIVHIVVVFIVFLFWAFMAYSIWRSPGLSLLQAIFYQLLMFFLAAYIGADLIRSVSLQICENAIRGRYIFRGKVIFWSNARLCADGKFWRITSSNGAEFRINRYSFDDPVSVHEYILRKISESK